MRTFRMIMGNYSSLVSTTIYTDLKNLAKPPITDAYTCKYMKIRGLLKQYE